MFNWIIARGVLPHIVIVLVAAVITGFAGWKITDLRLDRKEAQLEKQVLQNENDRKAYRQAQAEAEAKAQEVAREKEREYARIKAEQDASYSKLLTDYRAAVLRYTRAVQTGRTNPTIPAGTTAGVKGASRDSLIPVPEDDLRICADNTAKAQIAHDWVKSLKD